MVRQCFKPLSKAAKTQSIAAFDCEGVGGGTGFVCGTVVSEAETAFFTSRSDMLRYITSRQLAGHLIFAHNLDYDLALLTGGDLRKWELLYADTRLITATVRDSRKHKWTFADSRNLFTGFSVDMLGKVIGVPKLELQADIMGQLIHGATWSDLDLWQQKELREYNVRDATVVLLAVMWLQHELLSLGGQLGTTIAGCTMDLFRRSYLKTQWDTPDQATNDLFRGSYYGARTEPYRMGELSDLNGYDFTSLYPSVQATAAFPHPAYMSMQVSPRSLSIIDDYEGMAQCTVEVPESHVPVLPMRYDGKLFFPTGRLTGCWPLVELRHALSRDVKLVSVDWLFYSRVSFNPFAEFIDDLFSRRLSYKNANDTRERIFKLLLNSAYGRFGIRGDGVLQRLVAVPPDCDWSNYAGGTFTMYDGWPYVIQPLSVERQPAYCCVPIAAQIAAAARVRLHTYLSLESDYLAYTDTDSIFTSRELPTGTGLGELKEEFSHACAHIHGAKEYELVQGDGSRVQRVKGIPASLRTDYLAGRRVHFQSPVTIKEALSTHDQPGRWKDRFKVRLDTIPKRQVVGPLAPELLWSPTVAWDWPLLVSEASTGYLAHV